MPASTSPAFNFPPGRRNFIRAYRQMFGSAPSKESIEAYMAADKRSRPSAARRRKVDVTHHSGGTPRSMDITGLGRRIQSLRPADLVTVTKKYEWDMAHRIPDHQGKCARLHGHRYVAEIDITGPIVSVGSAAGMVIDFYDVKKVLDESLGTWDHKCMLYEADPMFVGFEDDSIPLMSPPYVDEKLGVFRVPFIPTAENMARFVYRWLNMEFNLNVSRVRIYETPNGWAEYKDAEADHG